MSSWKTTRPDGEGKEGRDLTCGKRDQLEIHPSIRRPIDRTFFFVALAIFDFRRGRKVALVGGAALLGVFHPDRT